MTKAWCYWCESGDQPNKAGYFWIHDECFARLIGNSSDIKHVIEITEGLRKDDSVNDFLARMYEHERRSKFMQEWIMKRVGGGKKE